MMALANRLRNRRIMQDERIVWGLGTSRTIRAHWALIELDLEYRTEIIRTRTPDTELPKFVNINPRQKIPVLQDGPITIAESAAIVTHLAESYKNGSTVLIPEERYHRARYFEWLSFICMELDATSLYVLRRHWALPEIYGDAPVANKASKEYFTRMINSAAKLIEQGQEYLVGDEFSGVDILMTSTLDWAVAYQQSLPEVFSEYRHRISKRPGYQAALKANDSE